ncbi:MAG: serine protease, partial [Anaerolineales bacterium]
MKRFRLIVVCGVFLTTLACIPNRDPTATPDLPTPTVSPGDAAGPTTELDDRQIRQNLVRATVQIQALVEQGSRLTPIWHGSGSILTAQGLILTNAHVVTDSDPAYRPDALGVAITVRSDQEPDLMYLAEIQAIDIDLDLAVIQIVRDRNGSPVDVEQLGLA